jgi:hypothetical protein
VRQRHLGVATLGAHRVKAPGKKVALGFALLLSNALLFCAAANAKNCLKVDDENSPAVTVSGRITTHHSVPKGVETRAAKGFFFLKLDTPLLADNSGGSGFPCYEWPKIAIMADDKFQLNPDDKSQVRRWTNQHVTIEGKLNRFGSALVDPSIFIEVTTIKKD